MNVFLIIGQFLLCGIILLFTGNKLAFYGDVLAEKTKLGQTWIGLIFIAATTSFPELSTTVSATLKSQPDLAAGNIFGSNLFNIFILGMVDFYPKNEVFFKNFNGIRTSHVLTALTGLLITGAYLFAMVVPKTVFMIPSVFSINVVSIFVFVIYYIGMRETFYYEREYLKDLDEPEKYASVHPGKAWTFFILLCATVGFIGYYVAGLGNELDQLTGWGETFIGNLFLAVATSLPELIVSITLIQKGLFDMLLGDILGSNIFNLTILAICDLFYREGSIIFNIEATQQLAASLSIFLTGIAIMGIYYQRKGIKRKMFTFGGHSLMIIIAYIIGMFIIFKISSHQ